MDCVFCKIVNGEIPCYQIYSDNICKVILNINPEVNGDLLLIPIEHFKDIKELQTDVLSHMHKVIIKMIKLLEEKVNAEGVTIVNNYGCVPEVNHFHFHIIPRYENDGVEHIYPKDNLKELEEIKDILTK